MTSTRPPNIFGLFRHGQTEWNVKKQIQGATDSPLTPEGIAELSNWAPALQQFNWQRILVSPQQRAVHTAEIINSYLHLPVSVDNNLREQDWGRWEGLTLKEIKATQAFELQKQIDAGWYFTPPDGESRKEVLLRAKAALINAAEKWPTESILVISHQGVIKCLVYSALGRSYLPCTSRKIHKNALHILTMQALQLTAHQLNIFKQ